jgi:uncharacterized membrane protein
MAYYALEARVEAVRARSKKEVTMYAAATADSEPHGERRSLYATSGAIFAGLLGLCLFAAPGGILGALLGALAGAGAAQASLKTGA